MSSGDAVRSPEEGRVSDGEQGVRAEGGQADVARACVVMCEECVFRHTRITQSIPLTALDHSLQCRPFKGA